MGTSLGPKGMDKIIQDENGKILVTNDGATILDNLNPEDHIDKLLIELSKSHDYDIGDGTTGVIILATSLLEAADPLIDLGIHPIEIADGYEKACQIAIENLIDISETFEQKKIDMEIM